jgi:chromosome segregation ATPase
MANIVDPVARVRQAVYGKEVRESIAGGLEAINTEVENTTARQTQLEQDMAVAKAETIQATTDARQTIIDVNAEMDQVVADVNADTAAAIQATQQATATAVQSAQTATANANTATANTNAAISNANTQATYAKQQGDYAKTSADTVNANEDVREANEVQRVNFYDIVKAQVNATLGTENKVIDGGYFTDWIDSEWVVDGGAW